ncbi:AaceriAAR181Wp [[Ashbya] aceris (nom. inval.)]|nr:AaceriAAR181Wp [[Ashbya] aceris (nom. inval.)]
MGTRESLYHAYRVLISSKDVFCGSVDIARESFCIWASTSSLTRPLLSKSRWFHDPEWNRARQLSDKIRQGAAGRPKASAPRGTRQYSTSSRRNEEDGEVRQMESSSVPSSRISRLFHYGSLAAGVGISAASQGLSQMSRGQSPTLKSLLLSDSNIARITKKFSQMRGAALKIGQMMSFQDSKVLPAELYQILSRVQNSAHYMPQRQLDRLMARELGAEWRNKFASFENVPVAAASIGQVHKAVLPNGDECVVKVQYPGVKDSIDSDLNNILMLLTASSLLPKGLFLEKTVANAKTELGWECDYLREAAALKRFEKLLADDPVFVVPHVYDSLTTPNIITMSRMGGTEIMKLPEHVTTQEVRNFICENIMRLCLKEIAEFKYMQTDPNWANFLYNSKTGKIELLDFGASRGFPDGFIHNYRKLLTYATQGDREGVHKMSERLGYLTGLESRAMINAHVDSVMTLGEPFSGEAEKAFDFSDQDVTDRIRGNISLMLNERMCPPPEETYSLHRKFSGVFLLCARMGAKVHCARLFDEIFALNEK